MVHKFKEMIASILNPGTTFVLSSKSGVIAVVVPPPINQEKLSPTPTKLE